MLVLPDGLVGPTAGTKDRETTVTRRKQGALAIPEPRSFRESQVPKQRERDWRV